MHSKTHSVLFNATQLHNLLFSQVFLQWVGVEFNASIIPPLLALVLQIREVDFNDEAALALPVLLILLRGAPRADGIGRDRLFPVREGRAPGEPVYPPPEALLHLDALRLARGQLIDLPAHRTGEPRRRSVRGENDLPVACVGASPLPRT